MKILILPMDGVGHVNACLGLGSLLSQFGHEIVFGLLVNYRPLVDKYPHFEVEVYCDPGDKPDDDFQTKWGNFMKTREELFLVDPIEQKVAFFHHGMAEFQRFTQSVNDPIESIIKKVQPDLIVVDFYVTLPAVVTSRIPWVLLLSANPLRIYEPLGAPPSGSGHPPVNPDPVRVAADLKIRADSSTELLKKYDEWLKSRGVKLDPQKKDSYSPYLNIYVYPNELDYVTEFRRIPEKWQCLEHLVRPVDGSPIGVDESFFRTHDKIVYFSLGSMGSAGISLMKRLVSYMAKSKHKYVVSKGPFHDEIQLPPNMVGAKYLNQLKVMSNVDLVITHGGNNTLIEALYHGKPVIVMPLFGDQHDNGRRVEDKKVGRCLYPQKTDEVEFLTAIDQLLRDVDLRERVALMGERIRASKSGEELNEKLKNLLMDRNLANTTAA